MRRSASSSRAQLWLLLLLWTRPALAEEAHRPESFGELYHHAEQLYEQGRYAESIAALRAAYAVKPLPRLLLNIGQLHLKLGQPTEALAAYEAYLRASPNPPPDVVATVEAGRAQARAMLAPVAAVRTPPRPQRGREQPGDQWLLRRWWFWGGLGVLAIGVATGVALGVSQREPVGQPQDIEVHDVTFRALQVAW